ncbi:FkbM family methyltransferase [Pseudophaeobacter sp. EL27]|uniref:FkbM family methyltransferase n=1 Tax=Pseudophaeobacter sp. EL27 TaxID=2107580 RepID=UPI000EFB4D28|nr:FkbM family methyltransferase [Pseudophaeobacter sp. EL27]
MASLKRWIDLKRNPWKAPLHKAMKAWKADKASDSHLLTYDDLPDQPVVLDIGGYEGGWSDVVLATRPSAIIHVFEPHPEFAKELRHKFSDNSNITIHECAIGSKPGQLELSDSADASSAFGAKPGQTYTAEVRSVADFFAASDLQEVDLVKINIEGGEYDLLPGLINDGLIDRIKRLQVQFHLFDPSWSLQRDAIREKLEATHACVWCYTFVWEEWRRK